MFSDKVDDEVKKAERKQHNRVELFLENFTFTINMKKEGFKDFCDSKDYSEIEKTISTDGDIKIVWSVGGGIGENGELLFTIQGRKERLKSKKFASIKAYRCFAQPLLYAKSLFNKEKFFMRFDDNGDLRSEYFEKTANMKTFDFNDFIKNDHKKTIFYSKDDMGNLFGLDYASKNIM